mmetsp:Transcript_12025/g.27830  ORF Transcript_12025/g.27830 Transcript_12025/m.27830 type:complete len:230 (-) Transcript_12025:163-852(-)
MMDIFVPIVTKHCQDPFAPCVFLVPTVDNNKKTTTTIVLSKCVRIAAKVLVIIAEKKCQDCNKTWCVVCAEHEACQFCNAYICRDCNDSNASSSILLGPCDHCNESCCHQCAVSNGASGTFCCLDCDRQRQRRRQRQNEAKATSQESAAIIVFNTRNITWATLLAFLGVLVASCFLLSYNRLAEQYHDTQIHTPNNNLLPGFATRSNFQIPPSLTSDGGSPVVAKAPLV